MVLTAASGSHADTRNKAVRLIANKLFAQPQLQDTIAAFARQMLFKLTATAATAAAAAATGASATAVVSAEQPGELPPPKDSSATPSASQGDPAPMPQPPSAPQQHQQHQFQSEEDGTRFAGLFCALCTKQQTLLQDLFLVFGRASGGSRVAIEAVAAGNDCPLHSAFHAGVSLAQEVMLQLLGMVAVAGGFRQPSRLSDLAWPSTSLLATLHHDMKKQ